MIGDLIKFLAQSYLIFWQLLQRKVYFNFMIAVKVLNKRVNILLQQIRCFYIFSA